MVRGVERRPIFVDDEDRLDLVGRLDTIFPEMNVRCFAWALMGNHVHLVVQTGTSPLHRAMHRIATGFAGRFNRRHERVGHLVQNRFKSRLVESESDLVGLIRYVHLNPLRAGLVGSLAVLAGFPWCGHGALVGALPPRRFHAVRAALALFGDDALAAHQRLLAWMTEGTAEDPPDATQENADDPVGVALIVLREQVCREHGIEPAELAAGGRRRAVARARSVIARIALDRLGVSCRGVAAALGVSRGAAARAARRARLESRLSRDDPPDS